MNTNITITQETMHLVARCYFTPPSIDKTVYIKHEDPFFGEHELKWASENGTVSLEINDNKRGMFFNVFYFTGQTQTSRDLRISYGHLQELLDMEVRNSTTT